MVVPTAVERSLNKIQQTVFSIFFWSASQNSSKKSSYLWGPWMPDRSHAPQPSKLASRSEGRAAGWASWRFFFWVRRHGYTKRAFPQHLWASTVAFGRLPFSIMSKLGRWRLWRCSKALAPMKAGNWRYSAWWFTSTSARPCTNTLPYFCKTWGKTCVSLKHVLWVRFDDWGIFYFLGAILNTSPVLEWQVVLSKAVEKGMSFKIKVLGWNFCGRAVSSLKKVRHRPRRSFQVHPGCKLWQEFRIPLLSKPWTTCLWVHGCHKM